MLGADIIVTELARLINGQLNNSFGSGSKADFAAAGFITTRHSELYGGA
jgi:hypothetical protein